jgi:hypothetical protein
MQMTQLKQEAQTGISQKRSGKLLMQLVKPPDVIHVEQKILEQKAAILSPIINHHRR